MPASIKRSSRSKTPQAWRKTHPDLFVKNVYEHAGLGTPTPAAGDGMAVAGALGMVK